MGSASTRSRRYMIRLLAFLIPAGILTAVSMIYGFSPFGEKSILMADMRYQFVDYYAFYRRLLAGDEDIFYTLSKTMGGDMAGFFAYYLASPLFYGLAFVENTALPGAILITMIIGFGLCGLSFEYFCEEVFGFRQSALLFSTAYALSGYLTGYFNCTHYVFNIMLFPLVMLGIIKIIRREKISFLYIVTLSLSLFSSYYIGYMTCIFAVIFFLFIYLAKNRTLLDIKAHLRAFYIFASTSCLSAAISAVSLFCAFFSLGDQKKKGLSLSTALNFNPLDVFSGLYTGSFHGNISDGLPLIYCGVIAAVLGVLFFINRNIAVRVKAGAFIVFLILILSFCIDALNVAWHGFAHPIGFPYRFSFIFIFFLLYISASCFMKLKGGLIPKDLIFTFLGFLLYSVYLIATHNQYAGFRQCFITLCLVMAALFSVYLCQYGRQYMVPVILGMMIINCMDLGYNTYKSIGSYFPGFKETDEYDMKVYRDYIEGTQELTDLIKDRDPSLYRMEKRYWRSLNDPLMFGYNGLSHFSSCESEGPKRFLGELGFRDNGNFAFYSEGSTGFADCFMGVKYVLSQYDETPKPYEEIFRKDDRVIFKNDLALPLVFAMTKEAETLDSGGLNHFEYQNSIAKAFTGKPFEIYRPVKDVKEELVNLEKKDGVYRKIDREKEAYIRYSFTADSGDFIYMYFDAGEPQEVRLLINDLEKQPYFSQYGWTIRELGRFRRDKEAEVKLILLQDEITLYDHEFYYEDINELINWYENAMSSPCGMEKVTGSEYKGRVEASDRAELLVWSLPYDENWTVRIDGEKAETVKALDALLAVEISPGPHEFEMKYIPIGFKAGLPITLIAILIFVIIIKLNYNNNRVKDPKLR